MKNDRYRWSVRVVDKIASLVIRMGGIGALGALLLVVLVLLSKTLPVFQPSRMGPFRSTTLPENIGDAILFGCDEHRLIYWCLNRSGTLYCLDAMTGRSLSEDRDEAGTEGNGIQSCQRSEDATKILIRRKDGSLTLMRLEFEPSVLEPNDLPADLLSRWKRGEPLDGPIAFRSMDNDRIHSTRLKRVDRHSISPPTTSPSELFDFVLVETDSPSQENQQRSMLHWIASEGVVLEWSCQTLESTESGTPVSHGGEGSSRKESIQIDLRSLGIGKIRRVILSLDGQRALIADTLGMVHSLERKEGQIRTRCVWSETSAERDRPEWIASCPMMGREAIVLVDRQGDIVHLCETRSEDPNQTAPRLQAIHRIRNKKAPSTRLKSSPTQSILMGIDRSDHGVLYHPATKGPMIEFASPAPDEPMIDAFFSPQGDGILWVAKNAVHAATFRSAQPEAGVQAFFFPIWYEGYDRPRWIWQGGSGTDASQAKWSVVPLLFGSFKGAILAMLIALPLGIMSAFHASEYMDRKMRNWIKPWIEWMASIPSIVLGFVAAYLLAPWLVDHLSTLLYSLVLIPIVLMVTWMFWKSVPEKLRCQPRVRLIVLLFVMACGCWGADWVAAGIDQRIFGTSLMEWIAQNERVDYRSRNGVLVGIVLGFAIIPTVFTIAEEAMQSVPQSLRAASISCGATIGQTAVRVVLPTAWSGLLSAGLIGFGRALGETMIVLLASGNTPLMELTPFVGFRSLAATLAIELPEATSGSLHFHTLMFASISLLILTLLLNTLGEWVRFRLRRGVHQG